MCLAVYEKFITPSVVGPLLGGVRLFMLNPAYSLMSCLDINRPCFVEMVCHLLD